MRTVAMDYYASENRNDDVDSVTSFEEVGGAVGKGHTQIMKDLIAKGPGKKALSNDEMPDVLYTVEYCNGSGRVFETRESDEPLDPVLLNIDGGGSKHDPDSPRKKPIIEIKSRVTSHLRRRDRHIGREYNDPMFDPLDGGGGYNDCDYGYNPPAPRHHRNSNRSSIGVEEHFQIERTEMVIHSDELIAALAAVVGYYPDVDFSSSNKERQVTVEAPYYVLVHHWRELEMYRMGQPACHGAEYADATARHIDVLLGFLKKSFGGKLEAEWARWNSNATTPATATFDMFWMLLKPGGVIYIERNGAMVPYVISGMSSTENAPRGGGGGHGGSSSRVASYLVDYWNVGYYKGHLQRQMKSTYVYPWVGEREISSLEIVPARFADGGGAKAKAVAEKQVQLGRLYWELAKGPAYKEYDGELFTRDSTRGGNMTGRVIVDCEGWERFYDTPNGGGRPPPPPPHMARPRRDPSPPGLDYLPQVLPRCTCTECKRTGGQAAPSPFAGFEKLDPKTDSPPENESLYFLVIKDTISAFILGERRWASLRVDSLREVKPDKDAFKYLVLDPEVKLTVKALIGKFASSDGKVSPWPNDFVKNKGEGRIFLLHGSPGVGKTCTAECVAELTHRPLLSLTSGDISTSMSASSVERNLHYFLELGERFGALVLLDEADVYLEERRTRDLRRNGLVSIFLRALEYYRGVLFLTTNRVEAFDSAFTSRIHVALHYRRLNDDDRRRVWMHNFERLERDSSGKCYVPQSAREYAFESADMKALRWNGREIRNGLQTAVALAETEAVENGVETVTLTDKHLRAVVKMSSGFKEFLRKNRKTRDEDENEGDSNEEEDEEEEEEDEEGSVSSAETEDNRHWDGNQANAGPGPSYQHPTSTPPGYHALPPRQQGY